MIDFETVNFESKPIQCDVCEKVFAAGSTLQLHREILHDENSFNDAIMSYKVNEVETPKSILEINLQVIEIKIEDYSLDTIKIEIDFGDVTLACEDKRNKNSRL